jgi:hypothetical protein
MWDLDHHIIAGVENTDSWPARKGDLQCAFPLDVLMVPSLKLFFLANINNLTGVVLTPGSTIHFGTIDYLDHLSLSPQEGDSSAIFVGTVHHGMPSLHTTLEETFDEDSTASGTEGSSGSPSPRGCNMVTLTDPVTNMPMLDSTLASRPFQRSWYGLRRLSHHQLCQSPILGQSCHRRHQV